MPVSPGDVWEVLADPGEYGYWVVGSKVIRDADANWPEPGSKFHHTIGFGPVQAVGPHGHRSRPSRRAG